MNARQVFSAPCNGCAKECFLIFKKCCCIEKTGVIWTAMSRNAQMCEGLIIRSVGHALTKPNAFAGVERKWFASTL